MRAKSTPLSALLAGTLGVAVMAGCQTYDFEPVDPLAIAQTTVESVITARRSKPDVMLLVDISGSMTKPVNKDLVVNGTRVCDFQAEDGKFYMCEENNPCDTSKCPTRWSELQGAMGPFLAESGKLVRFGLTTYPEPPPVKPPPQTTTVPELCAPATAAAGSLSIRASVPFELDSDTELQDYASLVNDKLQGIPNGGAGRPRGGTPTSASLEFVGTQLRANSEDRDQIIILLTDGLPNCNDKNEYDGTSAECRCTLETPSQCTDKLSPYFQRGCLDKNASVRAVSALKANMISTIVIGFGAETSAGDGPSVLNEMARAGGYARDCKASIDCGAGDTCDVNTGLCGRSFYQAGNREELAAALKSISEAIQPGEPCFTELQPSQLPSDEKLIVVYINGERTLAGPDTWSLDLSVPEKPGVRFTGSACAKLESSRPEDPVSVEVRAIRQL
ncbi:VWA domain-containing protein [Corallococcus sp. AB004]|uniref:adventurous gliding motility lipoprotein CglB n=1 Tax=Corallococcus TaxID=83461 RepID=UPI000EA0EBD5|nr:MULTISPECIES: adventurous gliding motility lipoprotein CglB [Corallococcus]RKI25458.1 VWA domain-containing protein [Corallococcus sp. AB004]NPC76330.1 adventurous gliding motility lipoprotein CglB [Corallococcus exiguus]NPD29368.1 adventurous gliding motility lipoprotein CglB [Corallococcus exiguus]NRD46072.1 adventurous gliding motility lipoprotein CglB [Corallococcus exiguus]RKH93751.1 VWA domain-containing protein [Corallococcus sp. AB038B]